MSSQAKRTPDAGSGLVDRVPLSVQPYLRLMRADRPVGVWLLFIPCVWGVLAGRADGMEAGGFWWLFILFLIGSFVMRSAGCVYNDLIDRDLDAQVERTRHRPIASGAVSPKAAGVLIVVLSLIGLLVLLQLGTAAILIGIASLALVAGYPFMKRITWWPQLWLGLTFNWGVLVASAAASGAITTEAALFYLAGIFWTLGYDTIYALQDIEDDALAGVKSTARRLGGHVRMGVGLFYAGTVLAVSAAMLLGGAAGWIWLLIFPAGHFTWQVSTLNPDDPGRNLKLFKANIIAGWMLAVAALPL